MSLTRFYKQPVSGYLTDFPASERNAESIFPSGDPHLHHADPDVPPDVVEVIDQRCQEQRNNGAGC
jgi:hypothetical protein